MIRSDAVIDSYRVIPHQNVKFRKWVAKDLRFSWNSHIFIIWVYLDEIQNISGKFYREGHVRGFDLLEFFYFQKIVQLVKEPKAVQVTDTSAPTADVGVKVQV